MGLLQGFEDQGHHIYMDNYYTSIAVFRDMVGRGFEACGTARTDQTWNAYRMEKK